MYTYCGFFALILVGVPHPCPPSVISPVDLDRRHRRHHRRHRVLVVRPATTIATNIAAARTLAVAALAVALAALAVAALAVAALAVAW